MMKLWRMSVLMLGASASCAAAGDQTFEDFFGQYFQRSDTITIGAGNAKEVNAASQILDPWPRYVRDRRIPANGARMTGAIQRYQDVKRIKEGAPTLSPDGINPSGLASSTAVSR
jgi:hypothetical protein